jgi:hypothetical protein
MKSALRSILAVAAGYAVWAVAFWVLIFLLALVWPALRDAGGVFFEQRRYDIFATSMLVAFQLMWPFANAAAGLVTRLISRRQPEVWCLAALLFVYFAYNHWWVLWDELPVWYNVVVVIPVVPFVLIGGMLGHRIGARRELASTNAGFK